MLEFKMSTDETLDLSMGDADEARNEGYELGHADGVEHAKREALSLVRAWERKTKHGGELRLADVQALLRDLNAIE